jgi:hypothetical protein
MKDLAFAIAKALPQSTGRRSRASTASRLACAKSARSRRGMPMRVKGTDAPSAQCRFACVRILVMGFSRMQREDPVRIIRILLGPGQRGTGK